VWAWKLERNETLYIHVQHRKLLQRNIEVTDDGEALECDEC